MKTPEGGKSKTKNIILGPALAPGPPHKNTEGKTYHWCGVSPLLNGSKPSFLKHPERFRYDLFSLRKSRKGFFARYSAHPPTRAIRPLEEASGTHVTLILVVNKESAPMTNEAAVSNAEIDVLQGSTRICEKVEGTRRVSKTNDGQVPNVEAMPLKQRIPKKAKALAIRHCFLRPFLMEPS